MVWTKTALLGWHQTLMDPDLFQDSTEISEWRQSTEVLLSHVRNHPEWLNVLGSHMAEGQIDPYAVHARIAMLGETTEWVKTAIHAGNSVGWTMEGYIHAREWASVCVRGWEQYGDMTDATLLEMATRNRWVWTHAVGMFPCEFEHDKQERLWRALLRLPYPLDSRQATGAALKALEWGIVWGRTAEKWETWKEEHSAWCTEVEKAFGLFEELHQGDIRATFSPEQYLDRLAYERHRLNTIDSLLHGGMVNIPSLIYAP